MKKIIFIFVIVFIVCLEGCKKNHEDAPSTDKRISSFVFKSADNSNLFTSDIVGIINKDTIWVKVPLGIALNKLVPEIIFDGKSIAPLSKLPQNFTVSVNYLVTAADGSSIKYVVIVSYLSTSKSIDSFVFKLKDNSGLPYDIIGLIGIDTIKLVIPEDVDLTKLVPTVAFTGRNLTPTTNNRQNFSSIVNYTVTAEDRSIKVYKVLVSTKSTAFIGSIDGNLYSVDAGTGALKWEINLGSSEVTSPCYLNGVVYIGTKNSYFYAIDAATGNIKWKFLDVVGDYSYPSVHNGMVYFYINGSYTYLYAIDTASGVIKWKSYQYGGLGVPTIVNGSLYYADYDGVVAYDAITGNFKWRVRGGLTYSNPAVLNNTLFSGAEQVILKSINATTGTVNWLYVENRNNRSICPTVDSDAVYVASVNGLYAINIVDGSLKWKFGGDKTFSPVIVSDGLVYAGTRIYDPNDINGGGGTFSFYALNKATGTPVWRNDNILEKWFATSGATIAHGVVFVNGINNNLFALNGATGEIKWTFHSNTLISTYPCVVDAMGKVFYNGNSGDQN